MNAIDRAYAEGRVADGQAITVATGIAKGGSAASGGAVAEDPLPDRITSRIDLSDPEGCWNWLGTINQTTGYGSIDKTTAHRNLYERLVEPVAAGLHVDHLCRNRACVNPDHLEPVTPRENTLRGETIPAANLAKTHCPRGHEYDHVKRLSNGNTERICRTCRRAADNTPALRAKRLGYTRAWRARQRELHPPLPRQRRTHCRAGHELTPDNVYQRSDGERACRTCRHERAAAYRAAQRPSKPIDRLENFPRAGGASDGAAAQPLSHAPAIAGQAVETGFLAHLSPAARRPPRRVSEAGGSTTGASG